MVARKVSVLGRRTALCSVAWMVWKLVANSDCLLVALRILVMDNLLVMMWAV